MPELNPLVGGSVKVKIKVGVQYISHGSGTSAVLDSTGTELDEYPGDVYGYKDAAGQTYFLDLDSNNTSIIFTTSSTQAWTETGTGTAARVETNVGAATKMINVDPSGAPIVDNTGMEARIV